MKIRVVEFRYVHTNPALWLTVFVFISLLFMLALVYCLQNQVLALILAFPLVFYAIAAFLYERTRRRAPTLIVDIDSIKWNEKAKPDNRVRFRTVETVEVNQDNDFFKISVQEKTGETHIISLPGLENRQDELLPVLEKKAQEYDFLFQS